MNKSDFEECHINPFDLKKGQYLWNKYSTLSKRKVFNKVPKNESGSTWYNGFTEEDLNSLIQFVVVFVDKKSPLASERDFDLRLQKSVEIVSPSKKAVAEIMNETDLYQNMVHQYFVMTNQMDYEVWFSKMITVHNMTKLLRRPVSLDDLDREMKAIKSASDIIETMESDLKTRGAMLFLDGRLEKMILSKATEDDLTGYAEEFARQPPYQSEHA